MRNKQIKYVEVNKLEKHRITTENRIKKLLAKQVTNEHKIESLIQLNESKREKNPDYNGNKIVRKIVKVSDKNQKIKNTIQRLEKRLLDIRDEKLEKRNILQLIGDWFRRIPNFKQKIIWGVLFTTPWIIGILLFFLPSFIKSVWWSFNEVSPSGQGLQFKFIGLGNYINLFTSYVIEGNNVFSVQLYLFIQNLVIDLPVIIIFSILIATFLSKPFKGSTIVKAIFFIPVIYNFTLISDTLNQGFGQYLDSSTGADQFFVQRLASFFLEIGIGGNIIEIILQAVERIFVIINLSGIQILIFVAAIQSIPGHLYEAAKIEGASKYVMFWKITISMITPFILTAAIYTVIDSFARAPIYRFLDFAMTQNKYGLAAGISVSYFIINMAIIGIVFLLMRKRVFYYDDRG
ncbi:carbohydrate ABC transporter permease [Acholeplasma hippikon]|uniref:Inner membrane ABC transporter permease protein ycjO n=1 Tax=Acholeplasma hippikon TaxID=264636 RepID=A0A449BID3_9MOLU|nr:sugar ABC transporter permease [Acholeplasma hippikon]VEU82200.1 Inner membrane ABC transporter permease protein ycjO [Acholeplasma hippikon]